VGANESRVFIMVANDHHDNFVCQRLEGFFVERCNFQSDTSFFCFVDHRELLGHLATVRNLGCLGSCFVNYGDMHFVEAPGSAVS
jgi:hypothetical protein